MKKFFTILASALLLLHVGGIAQVNTSCSAKFSITINSNSVKFLPVITADSALTKHIWNFGDAATLSDMASPTHTYPAPGIYTVVHIIKKITSGTQIYCTDTASMQVTIQPCKLNAGFGFVRDSIQTNKVRFYMYQPLNINTVTIKWIFGDGSYYPALNTDSALTTPTHVFAKSGLYNVCLVVQSTTCVPDTVCALVQIQVPPTTCNNMPYFVYQADSLQSGKIRFINYSTPAISASDSVSWTFGDGTSSLSHDNSIVHIYNAPGTYKVCLYISKKATDTTVSCAKEYCTTIVVPQLCTLIAGFTSKTDSLLYNKVYFTNTSTSFVSGDTMRWNFGDGAVSYDINPVHTYNAAGSYSVCLRVAKASNSATSSCIKEVCKTITIVAPACDAIARFTWKADSVNKKIITFTNTSVPASTTNVSVTWSFGDSTTATGWDATHTYKTVGKYYVCLRVQLSNTCVKYYCDTVTVLDNVSVCNLIPSYTWKADSVNRKKIFFTNTTIATIAANMLASWSFGDGITSSGWSPSHEYAQAGKYYVCLRIQYANTCVQYKCDSINVVVPPPVITDCKSLSAFNIIKTSSNSLLFYFSPIYPQTDVNYTWTFGDGTGIVSPVTSHNYVKAGTYNVCLTAFRNTGCASTSCQQLSVLQNNLCDTITVRYEYRKDSLIPNKVNFYSVVNSGIVNQAWTIGKNVSGAVPVTLTQSNPYYYFADTGYYSVCLKVTTLNGCTKEYCSVIHIDKVLNPCVVQAYPNPAYTQITLNVQLSQPEVIRASIYNIQNVLLGQYERSGVVGNNVFTIGIQNLVAGSYTIRLVYGNNVCYAKFQKF